MLRTLFMILLFTITTTAWSGEVLTDPEAVKNIFNNKTAYGKYLKKNKPGYNIYFASDGKVKKYNEEGEKDTGSWHIDSDGKHCVQFDSKGNKAFCRAIMTGFADGIYFRIKLKGDKKIKIIQLDDFRDGDQVPKD